MIDFQGVIAARNRRKAGTKQLRYVWRHWPHWLRTTHCVCVVWLRCCSFLAFALEYCSSLPRQSLHTACGAMAALLRAHPAPVPVPRGQAGHPLPVGTVPFVERVAAPPDEEDVHPPVPQTPKPRVVATPTPLPRRGPGGIRARHSGQPGRVWGDGGAKSRGRKPTGYNAPENSGLASPNFVADHPTSGTSSSPNRLHGKGSDKKPRHWVPPKVRPAVVAPSPGGSQAVYASHTSMGTSAPLRRAFRGHAPASPLQHPPPSKAKQNPFRRPATSTAGTGDVRVSTLRNSATGELRLARTQAALTAFADPFFHPTGGLDGGDSVDVDDGFGVDGGPSLRSVASFHSLRQGGGARARNRRLRRGGGRSTGDLHTRGGGVDAATASLVPTRFHRRGAARNKDVVDNLTADGSKRARVVAALAPASSSTQATPSRFRREIEAFAQSPLVKVNPPVQKQHHVVSRDVSFLQDTGSSTEAHHLLVGPTVSGVLAQPSNGERPMTSLAGGFPRSLSMVDEDEPSLHGQLSSTAPPKFGRRSTRKVSSASADGLRRYVSVLLRCCCCYVCCCYVCAALAYVCVLRLTHCYHGQVIYGNGRVHGTHSPIANSS